MHWSAFILGFFGSMHCMVMCGPILLIMTGQNTLSKFLISRITYNLGRVVTYTFIGLGFGVLGQILGLSGYQQSLSVILGGAMILLAFAFSAQWLNNKLARQINALTSILKKALNQWIRSSNLSGSFFLGIVNGFLPCGLVYAAVAGALATTSLFESMSYMITFGLGTFPAMLLIAISGRILKPMWLQKLSRFSSFAVFTLGILLVFRGLNLDIPFLSPAISFLYPSPDVTICN